MKYTAPKNSRSRSRIFNSRTLFVALAAVALLALATTAFMAPLPGAIFTTNVACTGTDLNIYGSKADVYVDGGPAHPGAAGLTPGEYYIQVTTPSGDLLGTSLGTGDETPVVVDANSEFHECYQLTAILRKASNLGPYPVVPDGYDTTTNPGGEYKVWVSQVSTFDNDSTKTDNFKVKEDEPPIIGTLNVIKFYDANANGINDAEAPLTGWKFILDQGIGAQFTPISVIVEADKTYTVTECSPQETNWIHTTPTVLVHTVPAGGYTFEFGNVCIAGGTGLTLGFWSNKNGQALFGADDLALMVSLNLVKADGSSFDPTNYAQFRTWILGATATNMANMLSAQLAAMELNVLNNKVSGSSMVYAPCLIGQGANAFGFISIDALMTLANTSLGANPNTTAAGAARTYQECLKNALDDANNNRNFVSPTPCPFSNFSCPNN